MPTKKNTNKGQRSSASNNPRHSSSKSHKTSSSNKRQSTSSSNRGGASTSSRNPFGGSPTRSQSTSRTGSFEELTKQELYERARRANIEGRSGMSKEQLMNALRRG